MKRPSNPFAGFWAGLTGRERTLILALILVFFLMSTVVLLFLRGSRTREARLEIQAIERSLELLKTKGAVYQERLEEKESREGKISSEALLFSTLLEEALTKVEDVTVSNQEEQPPLDLGAGLRKRVVEFDLRNLSLGSLTQFLGALEAKAGHIILTDRLLVRSATATEDRVNAEVHLATWERDASATDDEESEE
jgi:hypothetical protein